MNNTLLQGRLMAHCPLCGAEYDHPGLQLDQDFAESIGAEVGETCDNCSLVLISGSPAEIDALLGRVPCEYCEAYDCDCPPDPAVNPTLLAPPNGRWTFKRKIRCWRGREPDCKICGHLQTQEVLGALWPECDL